MIVLKRTAKGYRQDPTKYFNFQRFEGEFGDFVLLEAAFESSDRWSQFDLSPERLQELKQKKIVRLEFEEPNKFFLGDDMDSYDSEFHRIFTLCPYTAAWLNQVHGVERRVPIYFPFNETDVPPPLEKKYDVIYTGHIVSRKLLADIRQMSQFNYRFVSNDAHPLVTDRGVSYGDKLRLIAESRVTIVHNLLHPTIRHVLNVWKYPGWQKNEAFKLIPGPKQWWRLLGARDLVVPQLKSRLFEAAFCRSLILCKRDPFNVIERYFRPGEEFVYFDDGELGDKLREVLASPAKYAEIAERAHKRAMDCYTTRAFATEFLSKIANS